MPIVEYVASSKLPKVKLNEIKASAEIPLQIEYQSSEEYKDSLYPRNYIPLLPQILEPEQKKIKKTAHGVDIIKNLVVDNTSSIDKEVLINQYDTKLDKYTEKINYFDIDDNKKILLIELLIQNNDFAKYTNTEPQSAKLTELFAYCLDDIKKMNLNEKKDKYKLQKLYSLEINNFDNAKCRSIIFDDKYDLLPMDVINHIGTFYNANEEIDNFLSLGDVIKDLKKDNFFSKRIDSINGKFLYEFINLINNTHKDSDYKDLSRKDLTFCKTFMSQINTNANNGSLYIINNMLSKLRPKLSVDVIDEPDFTKEIDKKLSIINKLYYQIYSEISNEQIKALKNILSIEDGLKNVNIENINILTIEKDKTLNYIFNAIPGLKDTIGRKQAGHTYTLDKHIISVAQNVVKDDEYQKLDDNNKKILLIAALMHDITKKEGGADPQHPKTGAEFAYHVLKNVLNEKECLTLSNLIYNHHFNAFVGKESFINNVAYECAIDKNENFMQMLSILGKADLYGNPLIKDKYLPTLNPNIEQLSLRTKLIKQTLSKMKSQMALTPFPQNISVENKIKKQNEEELLKCKILSYYIDPKTNESIPVIDLTKMLEVKDKDKQKQYFETLGFGKDTTCDNLNLLVHAIDEPRHVKGLENLFNAYKSDAILSTSNITMKDPQVFNNRYCGVVLDSDNTNILEISDIDIFSGGQKKRSQIGNFLDHSINQSDSTLLETVNKIKEKRMHSEILVADFSISAIFVKKDRYSQDNIPLHSLLKPLFGFAQKYKLPVILIPEVQ